MFSSTDDEKTADISGLVFKQTIGLPSITLKYFILYRKTLIQFYQFHSNFNPFNLIHKERQTVTTIVWNDPDFYFDTIYTQYVSLVTLNRFFYFFLFYTLHCCQHGGLIKVRLEMKLNWLPKIAIWTKNYYKKPHFVQNSCY